MKLFNFHSHSLIIYFYLFSIINFAKKKVTMKVKKDRTIQKKSPKHKNWSSHSRMKQGIPFNRQFQYAIYSVWLYFEKEKEECAPLLKLDRVK